MRMSDAETIMWAVEKDPALRSDFTNISVLDRRPDLARLRAKVEQALEDIPRLAQRVVSPPLRIAPPEWQPDPDLDLNYHLRRVAVPAPGGTRELLDLAAALASAPLDRSRPLWEFTLVEGLEGDRAALLQRVHHTITDGVGGVKLSLSLLDFEPDPSLPETSAAQRIAAEVEQGERSARDADPIRRASLHGVARDALTYAIGQQWTRATRALSGTARVLTHPDSVGRGITDAARLAASIRRQVLITEPARSPLMRNRSLRRRFETFQVPLEATRRAASAFGGTVNDVFVTGVAGALGLYHERMGAPCSRLRMAMPVSTRTSDDDEANRFAPTRVLVPIQPKDPVERLALVHDQLAGIRHEPALAASESLAGLLTVLPTSVLVSLTRNQARTIDFATSNLRGSPIDLYIGGALIEANFPMGPRTGCALNITLLSYRGSLDMGLNIDPAAVTDPAALIDCLEESFGALFDAAH